MTCPCVDTMLQSYMPPEVTEVQIFSRYSDAHVSFGWFEGDVRNHKLVVEDDEVAARLISELPGDFSRTAFPAEQRSKTEFSVGSQAPVDIVNELAGEVK